MRLDETNKAIIRELSNGRKAFSTIADKIGITENTDAAVVVVSEQTGIVSLAADGTLKRPLTIDELKAFLNSLYRSNVSGLGTILRNFARKVTVGKNHE